MLCPGRSPLWPQLACALLACCFRSSAACCFSATEDYRSSHLDVYYIQYSPRLKSVVEVPIMPKTIRLGHLSPSGFAQTVGSPYRAWSPCGFGAHPTCIVASRGVCGHHCLFLTPTLCFPWKETSLQGDPTCCVFPEGSEFEQWLDRSLPGAAGHSSHRFSPVSLAWVSPATKRRDQILF